MNSTTYAGEPPYTDTETGNTQGGAAYDVGFVCVVLVLIIILCYTYYRCKRPTHSQSPPPATAISIHIVADGSDTDDDDDDHCMRLSTGLHDDILSTFPTFRYSEAVKASYNFDSETETKRHAVNYGSGCSICLVDYKPPDVLRLLPECGHLFHVSCIDTWLKVQSTCPICRKSPTSLTELT